MNIKLKYWVTFIVIMLFIGRSYAQLGVFYYKTKNTDFPNSQVTDIIEDEKNNILLLCSDTDENFRNTRVSVLNVENNGNLLTNKSLDIENIYNILKAVPVGKGLFKIYGNSTLNKSLSPLSVTIDDVQNITSIQDKKTVFSTYISDIYAYGKSSALVLYTRKGKDNRYGIDLQKENNATNKIEWLKKVSEGNNEEANKIIVSQNDDIYILAKDYEENLSEYSPKIYKLNENAEVIWTKSIEVPSNFYSHCISLNKSGNIIYACGYTRNQTGSTETRIFSLNSDGEIENTITLKEFSANGILMLSNGNYLLYGSTFYIDLKQVVTKGKYVLLKQNMEILASQALSKEDKPDIEIKGEKLTSSEFLTAYELSGDRFAIGGKVYMPTKPYHEYNQPLIVISDINGNFK